MSGVLKLGTRRSLLAQAQSGWVARELERLNPGLNVELVGIETEGDRIVDRPLRQIEGKEFFVKEIDEALAAGQVDLTVHSFKDLSLDRPEGFRCGAIPRRENPRDALLVSAAGAARLARGETIRIGSSSPRRLENIPPFLASALPHAPGKPARVEFLEIRGNVNTRLSRLQEPDGSPKYLDGVVLALAGLIRLWRDEKGRAELSRLLQGVRWMILPLAECPAAPAQGALAVECRADDAPTLEALARLHDPASQADVVAEREILSAWGGGCHQKFGATQIDVPELGPLLWIRGKRATANSGESFVEELRFARPALPSNAFFPWNGQDWSGGKTRELAEVPLHSTAAFVAHGRACTEAMAPALRERRVWTSGTSSWFRLAERGIWVEGCAESLGFDFLAPTLSEPVLGLPPFSEWDVLTHRGAIAGWKSGNAVATYEITPEIPLEATASLAQATDVFWASASQWNALKSLCSGSVRHYSGAGKTARALRAHGVRELTVFPSAKEWSQWIGSR